MPTRKVLMTTIAAMLPLSLALGEQPKSVETAPSEDQHGLLKDIASAPFPLSVTRVMDLLEQQIKYIAHRERLIIAFARGDYDTAISGLRKLADQGDGIAQLYMGVTHEHGRGVVQDHFTAVAWYQKAAEQGVVEAQNNLGVHYVNGQGIGVDYRQAYKWLYLAAAQGNTQASRNLGVLTQRMPAPDVIEARKLALNWITENGNDPRYRLQSLQ